MNERVFGNPSSVGPTAFHRHRECSWQPARLLPEGEHGAAGAGAAGAGAAGAGAAGAGAAGAAGGGAAGAAGAAGAGAAGAAGAAGQGAAGPSPTQLAAEKYGFPADTPVEQMTPDQRVAYYKASKDQWEGRYKALGVTPEQLATLREQAARADALDYELSSASEKAVKDAETAAKKAAEAQYVPALVRAEFKAAIAGKVPPEQVQDWISKKVDVLDLSKFLAADGSVDADKVAAFVEDLPATGTQRRGPSPAGQGYRPPGQAEPGAQGRAQAEKRFGIKPTANAGA